MQNEEGTKIIVKAPVIRGRKGEYDKLFATFRKNGYVRVEVDGITYLLEENIELNKNTKHTINLVIDRLVRHEDTASRLSEAIETAMKMAEDLVVIETNGVNTLYSGKYTCPDCGESIEEMEPRSFSFNNPYGACPECAGLGFKLEFDIDKIIPDRTKSINQGALNIMGFSMDGGKMSDMYMNALSKITASV
jgi:Excinuclease ATPase subunit